MERRRRLSLSSWLEKPEVMWLRRDLSEEEEDEDGGTRVAVGKTKNSLTA